MLKTLRLTVVMHPALPPRLQDPHKRPKATELLQHKFFKQARDEEYLVRHLLSGMPPLPTRVIQIRNGEAATTVQENDKNLLVSQVGVRLKGGVENPPQTCF